MSFAYRWPRKMETALIEFMATQPHYWDVKNKDYYNRNKRSQALSAAKQMLAENGFHVDVNSICKKFKNLRTIFIKQYKKANMPSANVSEIYEPIWEHYDQLLYLRDTSLTKQSVFDNNSRISLTDEDVDLELDGTQTDDDQRIKDLQPTSLDQGISSRCRDQCENITEGTRKKRKISIISESVSMPTEMTAGSVIGPERKPYTSAGDDDPAAFGILVAHKLRCLSVRGAMLAQTEIIAILQKFVLAELEAADTE